MKKLSIILFATIFIFASCVKDEEPETTTPSTNPTGNVVSSSITTNTVWSTGNVYIVDGVLSINGATLTIEPGTVVKFEKGSYINVGNSSNGSAIIANGTVDKPIIFTSNAPTPTKGDWNGIFFEDGTASTTSLKYCKFYYSGGYSSSYGTINLDGCSISMEYCEIKNSDNYGITLTSDAKFDSFTHNTLSEIANHPIKLYPNAVHTIGTFNDIIASAPSYGILIKGGTYDKANETWLNQTVPYIVDGVLNVENTAGCILNIEAGTTIGFTQGSYMNVANSSNTYATIKAIGSDSKHITFTSSAPSKTAGDWGCIFLEDGTSNSTAFEYCDFEYGGGYSSSYGIVNLYDCSASFTNCTFSNSETYGISLNNSSWFTNFKDNSFSSCASYAVKIYGNYAHTIGTGNTFNTNLGILVKGDIYEQANETWKKQQCAYYIDGLLSIESTSGSTLNIEPGTKIYFTQGSYINVGTSSNTYGKIIAQGTASERIEFSSAAPAGSASAGDWGCIFFEEGTSGGTIMDNCDFLYGGGYSSSYGMIDIDDCGSNVTISNCNFAHSQYHGISIDTSSANPTLTNNTFTDIAGDDIHNY